VSERADEVVAPEPPPPPPPAAPPALEAESDDDERREEEEEEEEAPVRRVVPVRRAKPKLREVERDRGGISSISRDADLREWLSSISAGQPVRIAIERI
jgi:hypothetical protein